MYEEDSNKASTINANSHTNSDYQEKPAAEDKVDPLSGVTFGNTTDMGAISEQHIRKKLFVRSKTPGDASINVSKR